MRNNCLLVARLFLVAALLLGLASSSVSADFSLRDWQYVKAITLPPDLQQDGLVEFAPDPEVFAGSISGLADLRIITGEGREVPYKLEIGKAERQQ